MTPEERQSMTTYTILVLLNPMFNLGWQTRVVKDLEHAYGIIRKFEELTGQPIRFHIRNERISKES